MTVGLRDMSDKERAALIKVRSHSPLAFRNWWIPPVAGFIVCSFIVSMVSRHLCSLTVPQQWYFFAGLFIPWCLAFLFVFKRCRQRGYYAAITRDIQLGKVSFEKVVVLEALMFDGIDEYDTGFVLKLDDGRALYFCAEQLHKAYSAGVFPNTEVELVTSINSKIQLDERFLGEYLEPKVVNMPDKFAEFHAQELTTSRQEVDWDEVFAEAH